LKSIRVILSFFRVLAINTIKITFKKMLHPKLRLDSLNTKAPAKEKKIYF